MKANQSQPKAKTPAKRQRVATIVQKTSAIEKDVAARIQTPGLLISCAEIAVWLRRPKAVVVNRIVKNPSFPKPVPGTGGNRQSALFLSQHLWAWASGTEHKED